MSRQIRTQETAPSTPTRSQPLPARQAIDPLPAQHADRGIVRRRGIVGWWLNLTAPAWPLNPISIQERERLRKAELTSLSLIVTFAFLLALVSNSLVDVTTAQGVSLLAVFMVIAAVLNRKGHTRLAAYFVPSAMLVILVSAVVLSPSGLRLIGLPILDLAVIPIILVSLTGDREATWIYAFCSVAFVIGSFVLVPHEIIRLPSGATFDGIGYEQAIFGVYGLANRHVALLLFAAFFGWLGARSVDKAIARADRAEEVARLQMALLAQKQELEEGIRAIQQVQVRVANGDFNARAPLPENHSLWQISHTLNTMILRMERNANADAMLQRIQADVDRLVYEIQQAKAGQRPHWPQQNGTLLDPLMKEIAGD